MFEKEAYEYREKGKRDGYYLVTQEMEQEALDYIIDETFKDGAEFGYNKCKEEINQKGLALQSDMDETIEQNFALKTQIEKMTDTETMLKILKDRGVIRSWYYNGTYHVGDELPKESE